MQPKEFNRLLCPLLHEAVNSYNEGNKHMKTQTPKGFRDFLPADMIKRQFILQKIRSVFEKFGFDPLETPTLEYAETLTGKYGEEERLIYKFETQGGDKVALKYDQTVPLARVVAQYGPNGAQVLPIPFKRYQIQSAFRGENTQKGRYREFLQCDVDIVGVNSPLCDAEILAVVYEAYTNLGLEVSIKVNDRTLLQGIEPKYLATIDKLLKIGREGVISELTERGLTKNEADELLTRVEGFTPTPSLQKAMDLCTQMEYPKDKLLFDPTLVRGLDYYTGIIIEVVLTSNVQGSSLGGGGRWDTMIGRFTGQDLPAVGFAIGFDRTLEAMQEQGIPLPGSTNSQVLVTIFEPELTKNSVEVCSRMRSNNITTELWLDAESKLDKQFKYADKKGIPYVVVIGPQEAQDGKVSLKDLAKKTQETITLDELIDKLRQ
jgi:histidyl-tRNA synthetase